METLFIIINIVIWYAVLGSAVALDLTRAIKQAKVKMKNNASFKEEYKNLSDIEIMIRQDITLSFIKIVAVWPFFVLLILVLTWSTKHIK